MTKIYDQHRATFANVSAYVIAHKGQKVATIAIKFPKDGAGRLYAYVHWLGTEMVRGHASGYGYDKRTAACANAARNIPDDITGKAGDGIERAAFIDALSKDSGHDWTRQLELAGFDVWQAI